MAFDFDFGCFSLKGDLSDGELGVGDYCDSVVGGGVDEGLLFESFEECFTDDLHLLIYSSLYIIIMFKLIGNHSGHSLENILLCPKDGFPLSSVA